MNSERTHGHYKGKHFVEQPAKGKGSYDRKKHNIKHNLSRNKFVDTG